jgi:hypothetical protein
MAFLHRREPMSTAKKIQSIHPTSGVRAAGMRIEVVDVTPEMAAQWLENNCADNRNLRRFVVEKYARDMEAGRWELTHQGIAFDKKGRVVDGQHRLSAVALSGVTVRMVVAFETEMTYGSQIDRGALRTVTDITKVGAKELAALRAILCLAEGKNYTSRALSASEVPEAMERFREEMDWIRPFLNVRAAGVQPGGAVLGAMAFAYPLDRDKISEFAQQVISGEMIGRGDPAYALRVWLASSAQAKEQRLRAFATLGACRHALEGKTMASVPVAEKGYRIICARRRAHRLPNTPTTAEVPSPS